MPPEFMQRLKDRIGRARKGFDREQLHIVDFAQLTTEDTATTPGPEPLDRTEEIELAIRNNDVPFMGTGELASELGYKTNPGMMTHLERAEEQGLIKRTKISGYNIWYLPSIEK